jgi:hypothetical protein
MAYEDPNAPSQPQTPAPAAPVAAPAATPEKKSGSWDWLWPSIVAVGPSSFRVEPNSQNRWSSSSPVGMWAGCI